MTPNESLLAEAEALRDEIRKYDNGGRHDMPVQLLDKAYDLFFALTTALRVALADREAMAALGDELSRTTAAALNWAMEQNAPLAHDAVRAWNEYRATQEPK